MSVPHCSSRSLACAYPIDVDNALRDAGRTVSTLEEIVYTGILASGAIAAGQLAWLGMDKVIGRLGVEPKDWLAAKLRSDG